MTTAPLTATDTAAELHESGHMRLILRIGPKRLSALMVGPEGVDRNPAFIAEELADGSVKALENAIYDNPALLGDFDSVHVIFATTGFFTAPEGCGELHEAMADAMLPDFDAPRTILAEPFGPGAGGEVCYAVDSDILNFIARTFACARFHHTLAVSVRGLAGHLSAAPAAAMYALCEGTDEMTLAGFGPDGRVRYLNLARPQCAADCAYHLLAAALPGEQMIAGGQPALTNEVCETVQKADPHALIAPLTLPQELLEIRRKAPDATFDLIFMTAL